MIAEFKESFWAEQGPEEILRLLQEAAEKMTIVKLTVAGRNPEEQPKTAKVQPWAFKRDVVWIETADGDGMTIELDRIKMVQPPEGEDKPATTENKEK